MHLARTSISTLPKPKHNALVLSRPEPTHFTLATDGGFELWQLYPLRFVFRRDLPGSLGHASAYGQSSLFFLVGGGPAPVFSPNKVVLWDESRAAAVVELEFRERVLGLESRSGLLAVVFLRRVVLFEIDEAATATSAPKGAGAAVATSGSPSGSSIKGKERATTATVSSQSRVLRRIAEWLTVDNPLGLIAMASAPGSSLLAIPGRQAGHVHLLHVHPAPSAAHASSSTSATLPPARSQIVIAHTTALSTLTCSPSGALVTTTSARGTLVRVFSGRSGALERELRRGADKAVLRQGGVAFGGAKAEWLAVWSDKGTIHAFSLDSAAGSTGQGAGGRGASGASGGASPGKGAEDKSRNRPSTLSKLLPYLPSPLALPKYFLSEWAHATYTLPTGDRHSTTLASLGSTLARGAAAAASAASGGADAAGSPRINSERDRLPFEEEDEEEDERCVLAWVEVDVERERARLRARKHGPAGARRAAQAHARGKHRHRDKQRTGGGSVSDDDGIQADRVLHPSSLPRPAPPAVLPSGSSGVRARTAGTLHTPHRRDIEPPPGRRPHLPATIGSRASGGGFRSHLDRPHALHRTSSAASGGQTGAGRQTESQLIALTFSGGFYRLALPASTFAGGDSLAAGGSSSDGARTGSDNDDRHAIGPGGSKAATERSTASGGKAGGLGLAEYRRFGAGGWAFTLSPGEDGRPWNELGEW